MDDMATQLNNELGASVNEKRKQGFRRKERNRWESLCVWLAGAGTRMNMGSSMPTWYTGVE